MKQNAGISSVIQEIYWVRTYRPNKQVSYTGCAIFEDSWAVKHVRMIEFACYFHVSSEYFSPLAARTFNCFRHVSGAFWYLDWDKPVSYGIKAFQRSSIHETFCPASLCFSCEKSQESPVWMRTWAIRLLKLDTVTLAL